LIIAFDSPALDFLKTAVKQQLKQFFIFNIKFFLLLFAATFSVSFGK